jgi:polar amino acid transport system substrate-binding protein
MGQAWRAALACALLLTGCSVLGVQPSSAPTSSATPTAAQSASPTAPPALIEVPADELLFEGSLLICSDLPYPPQEFFDEAGNPIGSDIEIGQEIARRLGLEARIVNSVFDTIIDAVNNGKCDIVISAQNITADRLSQVDMIPYFQAGQTFIVRHGNPAGIRSQLDLCGRVIAAQGGTVMTQLIAGEGDYAGAGLSKACIRADKPAIELSEFEKDDEALAALIAGDVDAYFTDSPVAGYHVVQNISLIELSGLTLEVAVQGISVPKDQTGLREAVEAALESMMEDGTYLAILARYGVQEGSVAGSNSR